VLHFLIGVAVCIWIAERVARFLEHRRQKRNYKRGMAMLNVPLVPLQDWPPQPSAPSPPERVPVPTPSEGESLWIISGGILAGAVCLVSLALGLGAH
jgi:hypothetical protein